MPSEVEVQLTAIRSKKAQLEKQRDKALAEIDVRKTIVVESLSHLKSYGCYSVAEAQQKIADYEADIQSNLEKAAELLE
jgi:hypothetical protein